MADMRSCSLALHLVPFGDISSSNEAVRETFLLTNICPQVAFGFNRGYWAYFEKFVRNLRTEFDHVYIYTGPLFLPEKDQNGLWQMKYQVLGDPLPTISVPTHFFKVIFVENDDANAPNTTAFRALGGFVLPNQFIADETPLTDYIFPISEISHFSGLVFFEDLDVGYEKVQPLCDVIECKVRIIHW